MSSRDRDAIRAMVEFIDTEAESIAAALTQLAERCVEDAKPWELVGERTLADAWHTAGRAWLTKRDRLLALYEALPSREEF